MVGKYLKWLMTIFRQRQKIDIKMIWGERQQRGDCEYAGFGKAPEPLSELEN